MPTIITHQTWEEAFDKANFDGGDSLVITYAVTTALENAGHEARYNTFGIHTSGTYSLITTEGTALLDENTVDVRYTGRALLQINSAHTGKVLRRHPVLRPPPP